MTTHNICNFRSCFFQRVNCPFYWKIGACRHGENCARVHNRPPYSPTLLIPHMYSNPQATMLFDPQGNPIELDKKTLKKQFDEFYEDIFDELSKYGRVKELNVCDNVCEHLLGNVYVKYEKNEEAADALKSLSDRYYAGMCVASTLVLYVLTSLFESCLPNTFTCEPDISSK